MNLPSTVLIVYHNGPISTWMLWTHRWERYLREIWILPWRREPKRYLASVSNSRFATSKPVFVPLLNDNTPTTKRLPLQAVLRDSNIILEITPPRPVSFFLLLKCARFSITTLIGWSSTFRSRGGRAPAARRPRPLAVALQSLIWDIGQESFNLK